MNDPITTALSNHKAQPKSTTTAIEFKERLAPAVSTILNEQIKNELFSSQIYKAMAACVDNRGFVNGGKLFFKYGQEELVHMDKIYNYLMERNCKPIVPACEQPKLMYNDIKDVIQSALEHEIQVTANWEKIAETAKTNGDNTTYEFSQWFLKEQIEEENKFRELLFKLDFGIPLWELESVFASML